MQNNDSTHFGTSLPSVVILAGEVRTTRPRELTT